MDVYEDCLNYLDMLNIMARPKMPKHLTLKQCLQDAIFTQKIIAEKLAVDPERLKIITYHLDIAINFRVPMNEGEKVTIHARNLDYFLASRAAQSFLTGKSETISTRYGIIKA